MLREATRQRVRRKAKLRGFEIHSWCGVGGNGARLVAWRRPPTKCLRNVWSSGRRAQKMSQNAHARFGSEPDDLLKRFRSNINNRATGYQVVDRCRVLAQAV